MPDSIGHGRLIPVRASSAFRGHGYCPPAGRPGRSRTGSRSRFSALECRQHRRPGVPLTGSNTCAFTWPKRSTKVWPSRSICTCALRIRSNASIAVCRICRPAASEIGKSFTSSRHRRFASAESDFGGIAIRWPDRPEFFKGKPPFAPRKRPGLTAAGPLPDIDGRLRFRTESRPVARTYSFGSFSQSWSDPRRSLRVSTRQSSNLR